MDVLSEDMLEPLPDEGKIKCLKCEKLYSTMTNARRHIRDAHIPHVKVQCQLCPRSFTNERYRTDHYRSFHGLKPESRYLS